MLQYQLLATWDQAFFFRLFLAREGKNNALHPRENHIGRIGRGYDHRLSYLLLFQLFLPEGYELDHKSSLESTVYSCGGAVDKVSVVNREKNNCHKKI